MTGPERAASSTAVGVAILRALHVLYDGDPKILDDSLAARLVGRAAVERAARERDAPERAALRSHIVLRSRFAEDCLAAAVRAGVRQYVLLGAGLDTFAYRQPAWARALRIFEVDHPASQRAKRERLERADIAAPDNLEYAPADFERHTLRDVLALGRFDLAQPAVFACLGVLVYLDEAAIDAIFSFVASLPPRSELVFTFAPPRSRESPSARNAAALGEPWRTRHTPAQLLRQLNRCGLAQVGILEPDAARRRYYQNRTDGLPPPQRRSIARAVVGGAPDDEPR